MRSDYVTKSFFKWKSIKHANICELLCSLESIPLPSLNGNIFSGKYFIPLYLKRGTRCVFTLCEDLTTVLFHRFRGKKPRGKLGLFLLT